MLLLLTAVACGRPPTANGSGDQTASPPRTQTPSAPAVTATPLQSPIACAAPSPRGRSAFAYFASKQVGVLFGGQDPQNKFLSDTWQWKAGCWTQLTPMHGPPTVALPEAAYDPGRGVVVMYGYDSSASAPRSGTWTWDGNDWSTTATSGPDLLAPAVAYDPNSRRVLMFGETINGGTPQTWTWDGVQWQQLAPPIEASARQQAGMALDSRSQKLLLFGGISGGLNQELADTWSWNGANWTQLKPATSPPPRAAAVLVSASAQGRVLLVGGEHAPAILSDTWQWDGSNWTSIASFGTRGGASAIDTGTQVILFGGWSDNQVTNETWTWNGTAWANASS